MPGFYKNSMVQKLTAWGLIFSIFISLAGVFLFPKSAMAMAAVAKLFKAGAATTAAATCAPITAGGTTVLGSGDVAAGITPCTITIQASVAAGETAEAADAISKELLQMAWHTFRKMLLDYMVDEIIKWIQGEGDPAFVTDWGGFMKNVTEQAGGFFLQEMLGKDLMAGLCQPDWAMKINLSLGKPKKFATRAMCTFKDIGENFNKFMDNFSNGGWKGWITVTEAQNNPYGLYLMALNEKLDREIKAQTSALKDAESGFGFLSDKVCKKLEMCDWNITEGKSNCTIENGTFKKEEFTEGTGDTCLQWQTRTPGKMMADAMNFSVSKDIDWLINNQELEAYVAAISDALLNRILEEGVLAITSTDVSSEDGGSPGSPIVGAHIDNVPTVTKAESYDEYSYQITSNEPGMIYYTLDGTEPTVYSPLYNRPITILSPTTLKWFGVDYIGNKEGTHTMDINPPFIVPAGAPPSTVAVAVGSNSIALRSTKPTTIYYTTNITEPTTSSGRYIKKFDIGNPSLIQPDLIPSGSIIKWFAIDSAGNQSTVKSASFWPPFPNAEFSVISDLVTPVANISIPITVSAGTFFKLDPTGSADYDATPRIVMYEWDFDNDGAYDWWTVDWNRDGVFDESQCRSGAICTEPSSGILNGFLGMQVPTGGAPGVIDVKYSAGFARQMGLRVTDDEGLSAATNVVVDVE